MCSSHHHGQTLAPWAGQSSYRPTSLRWKSPNWKSTIMILISSLRNAPGGSIGMCVCMLPQQALACGRPVVVMTRALLVISSILFSVKLWSTWSNTLKHKSLVIESRCMTGGRISTLPCPCPLAETKYVFFRTTHKNKIPTF